MQGFIIILLFVGIGFVLFNIYFFFKALQFVISAINLYKKMINREDAIIKLLIDIRDNTKKYSESSILESTTDDSSYINTNSENLGPGVKCPKCNYIFRGEFGEEGWWCPKCNEERH